MFFLPAQFIILINGALIIITITVAILLAHLGTKYSDNTGDSEVQERLKKIILRLLMLLFFISLAAAAFNLLVSPS